jgi:shikimate dehydrogenase
MHNAALADLARTAPTYADWRYFRFDVPPADLPRALAALHAKKFRGLNLTVPHKVLARDLVARVDPAALPVGAVNTLRWAEDGWHGFNTDGYGLATAVRATLGRELAGAPVILLGAGGAARGAAVECLQRGCTSLTIVNRTRENLDRLLVALAPAANGIPLHGLSDVATSVSEWPVPAGAIVINATSAGLRDTDPAPIDLAHLPRPACIYDMIYNPPRTRLLLQAEALGLPCANGLTMLVHQGAKALEIWTGVSAAETAPAMAAALQARS